MGEGARLQAVRSLRAWLHLQPASCLFSGLNHEGMSETSLPAALGCLRKKRVFTYDRAASSRSVLSYKFTSQTLTWAGVSCVCSLGSCLFGKQEMLQCRGGGLGFVQRGSAEKQKSPESYFFPNPSS